MRYFRLMGMRVPRYAALLGLFSITATSVQAAQPAAQRAADSISPATRFDRGASATFAVSARIIRQSARIGHGLGPPAPRMVARATLVSAADGRAVPALVYDFE